MSEYVGYIYKITNLLNGKIYVGKRQRSVFDKYYWGSGKYISNSIELHGVENFSREVIEWCTSEEQLNIRERFWISELDARNPSIGYNLSEGGDGSNVGGKQNANYCFVHNDTQVLRILKTEVENYLSNGYVRGRGYGSNGACGKERSIETRSKMSASGKGKHNNKGEHNPCFGLKYYWVNDGVHNKRVCLTDPIPDGYVRGKIQKKYIRTEKQQQWDQKRSTSDIWKGSNNPGKSMIGSHWYNNGKKEALFFDGTEPTGYVKGRIRRHEVD